MVTQSAFTVLVALVALQRIREVTRSRRHARALLAQGGREHAHWQVPAMAALHTAWLVGSLVEVWWIGPPFRPFVALAALSVFVVGQWMRAAAMSALGDRWTVPVMTLPGRPAVASGIYRYLRHPNYLGVILEIAALPLVHGALRSALIFSVVNGLLLTLRIRAEEEALAADGAYVHGQRAARRLVPSWHRHRDPHDT